MGGAEGKAAFIDTEGTFRPERIKSIAERFGVDPDQALENILVARGKWTTGHLIIAFNSENVIKFTMEIAARMAEEKVYRVLIIDSIIAPFRTDYAGRGELSERYHQRDY